MKFLKSIFKDSLFKFVTLNSLSVALKIGIGFVTSKCLAVFVGASGMAFVGNFRNFLSSTEAISTLGLESGIVTYVSENKNNATIFRKVVSTAFFSLLSICFLVSLTLYFASSYFDLKLFEGRLQFQFVIQILAVVLPFYIGNIFFVAIINGLGNFKKVLYVSIFGSILGLIFSMLLISNFKIQGALLSLIFAPSLLIGFSFFQLNKQIAIFEIIKFEYFDFSILKNFSSFTLMAMVSSVFGPLVLIAIRTMIIDKLGLQQAGFYEAISRISSYYLLFILSILSIYFLPKMAQSKSYKDDKILTVQYLKGVLPVFGLGLILVYFARFFIVKTLFTSEFIPTTNLFFWQLIGDFLKAASFVLAFQFYAKKLTKAFIFFELLSLSIQYFATCFFMEQFQIEGIVMAHAYTYLIYLVVLCIYFRKSLI